MLVDYRVRNYRFGIMSIPDKDIWIYILFIVYLFMSFFEGYVNYLLGSITKYFVFVLILAVVFRRSRGINLPSYTIFLVTWLIFKNVSLFWGSYSYLGMQVVNAHFFSQILMVLLFAVVSSVRFSERFVDRIIDAAYYFSALLSALAIFFSKPYHGIFTARFSLTIAGIQIDPNDLSAFYLFCVVVSLYRIITTKKTLLLSSCILFIATIASGMTASRGGLVSYIVLVAVMTIFGGRKRVSFIRFLKRVAVILLILTILYLALGYLLPTESFERLFVNTYEGGSGRVDIWRDSVRAFTNSPLMGFGWGGSYFRVHNTYLNILVDNGLVGLLLFTSFVVLMIQRAVQRGKGLAIYIMLAGIVPAFFIEAITKRFFWNAFILGVLIVNSIESDSREQKASEM